MNIVYSLLPDCNTDTFLKFSEMKRCSKISKTVSFSLTLQPWSPEFVTLSTTDSRENVSFEYSEIAGSLAKKGLWWSHLITLLKKYLYTFLGGCWENCCLWKFRKIIKKTSLVALLLKNSSCPIHPPITIPKTDFTSSVSFVCSGNFQNCWESVCVRITF